MSPDKIQQKLCQGIVGSKGTIKGTIKGQIDNKFYFKSGNLRGDLFLNVNNNNNMTGVLNDILSI